MTSATPSPPTGESDVLVLGGGVIGLSVAWALSEGAAQVVLIDPQPGRGASWAAAGMLAPVTEVHYQEEPLLALNLASARLWPLFASRLEEATGAEVGYRACGTLAVAADSGDLAWLSDLHRFQTELGLDAEGLPSRRCREIEPALSPGIRGGVLVAGDHQVDPRRLTAALAVACHQNGVEMVAGSVIGLEAEDGACRAAVLDDGRRLRAGRFVLCAGAWSNRLASGPGVPEGLIPPIRPVKGQILRLRHRPGQAQVLSGNVRGLVNGSAVYMVPRSDGEVVVGATMEEQGYDVTVTAGAVHELLRDSYALVPELAELAFVEAIASLRPCSPDNAPVIGPTALDGLLVATGHYRNGVLLAPVTADLVAELVMTGAVPEVGRAFGPERFKTLAA
jgi:glycine oxidase